jgi:RimJ/RimL family protein N-acetyltransferase
VEHARPSPLQVLDKLRTRAGARGPTELLSLSWQRIREAVYSRDQLIFFVRATDPSDGSVEEPEGLSFREGRPSDGPLYARDIGTDSPRTFAARLSTHTRCFVVERGALLVHATWMTTAAAWTREISLYVCPPAGEAYVYESFTRPEVRGRGVYPFALRRIAAWLAATGIARVWVAVEGDNPASLRAVHKAGFTEAFTLDYGRTIGTLSVGRPHDDEVPAGFLRRRI